MRARAPSLRPAIAEARRAFARWRIPAALLAAASCLAAGIALPIVEASRFLVFRRPLSILDGVGILLADGDWALALIIVAFSIVFPALKIAVTATVWLRLRRGAPASPRLVAALERLGKWSMLDVFVVALVIVSLKTGGFSDATTAPALYPFVVAILLTAFASGAVARDAEARPAS